MSRFTLRLLTLVGTLSVVLLAQASPGLALDGLKVRPLASFGGVQVGSCDLATYAGCKIKTLTLENAGSEPIRIGGFGIGDLDPLTAALVTGLPGSGCEFLPVIDGFLTLNPQASCAVSLAFNPVVKGRNDNTLQIWSTDPSSPIAVIPLFAVGT